MLFDFTRSLGAGATIDPDPRGTLAVIGSIPDAAVCEMKPTPHSTDVPTGRIVLTLDSTLLADAVDVEIWALEEKQGDRPGSFQDNSPQAQKQARKWYRASPTPIHVINGELAQFAGVMPGPGKLYFRLISGPTNASRLLAAFL